MLLLPAAIGAFLLVNLLCACIALGVGFAAGVWFFGAKMAKPAADEAAKKAVRQAGRRRQAGRGAGRDGGQPRGRFGPNRRQRRRRPRRQDEGDLRRPGRHRSRIGQTPTRPSSRRWIKCWRPTRELQQRLEMAEKQLAVQAAEIKAHESEARTDSLTGLSNRRAFDDELKRRLSEWQRKGTPCTLVMLDIDFFKKFNDTHGHQVGDEVLRQVAKVLSVQSREMDMPCRYGGEEFGVILPATDAAEGLQVAERIRAAIEESTTVCDGKKLKVTCSLGISEFHGRRRCRSPDSPGGRRTLRLQESRPQLRPLEHRHQARADHAAQKQAAVAERDSRAAASRTGRLPQAADTARRPAPRSFKCSSAA